MQLSEAFIMLKTYKNSAYGAVHYGRTAELPGGKGKALVPQSIKSTLVSAPAASAASSASASQQLSASSLALPILSALRYSDADFLAAAKKDAELQRGWTLSPPPSLVAANPEYEIGIMYRRDYPRWVNKGQVWYDFYKNDALAQQYFYTVAGQIQWDKEGYKEAKAKSDFIAQGGAANAAAMRTEADRLISAASEIAEVGAEAEANLVPSGSFIAKNKYYLGAGVLLAGIVGYIVYQRQKAPLERARAMVQRTL
jgi:hypothetical protein